MALTTCPDCGSQISDQAPVCLGCGCPRDSVVNARPVVAGVATGRGSQRFWWVFVIALAVVFLVCVATGDDKPSVHAAEKSATSPVRVITAFSDTKIWRHVEIGGCHDLKDKQGVYATDCDVEFPDGTKATCTPKWSDALFSFPTEAVTPRFSVMSCQINAGCFEWVHFVADKRMPGLFGKLLGAENCFWAANGPRDEPAVDGKFESIYGKMGPMPDFDQALGDGIAPRASRVRICDDKGNCDTAAAWANTRTYNVDGQANGTPRMRLLDLDTVIGLRKLSDAAKIAEDVQQKRRIVDSVH